MKFLFSNDFTVFFVMFIIPNIKLVLLLLLVGFLSNGCGLYKRSDVKDNPVNVEDRVRKNIEEGRGVRFGIGGNKGGVFDFASSNELWRASVEILDFVPLVNASYSGGIIITDWFNNDDPTKNETQRDLKITVRFLTNEIRSDAIDVKVHERLCTTQNSCSVSLIDSSISDDIELAILKKATILEKMKIDENIKERRKKSGSGKREGKAVN